MNKPPPHIYRFADVELDPSKQRLIRNGQETHLRQKTFQVLSYLVEQRQRLVTKDELIEKIWQGAAVTDNTLEQCLAEMRRLLGDDSRRPRFIKTIPRAGYRFIAEVTAIDDCQVRPGQPAPNEIETSERIATKSRRPLEFRTVLIGSAILLVVVAGLGAWFIKRQRDARQTLLRTTLAQDPAKRPLAVMFFDNESASSDLDWLREGLADMIITDLSRSNNLAVLSRQQLRVLLDRMAHTPAEKITLDEALEVARQTQAKLLVLGSFAKLGDKIRIDVHLHDARDGQLLTAERLVVDEPGQILSQVDLLSLKLATYLSATPANPQASLANVMTNNLEAYRYYSLGVEKAQGLQNSEAIALFEKAVALDPDFAMAHARIGYIYAVTWGNLPDKGKVYLEKAFQLSGRLTEKDRLYIAGWYAIANYDYAGAINSFREIVARFPLEVESYRRLGNLLEGEEKFPEAIEILKQGLVIDSGAKDLYNALGSVYEDLGRHEEAIESFQHYVQLGPQEPNAHDSLGSSYQWAGRYDEAIAEYKKALELKPDFEIAMIHLGNTYFQQGRYSEAIKEYQRYIQDAPSDLERMRGYASIAYTELRRANIKDAQAAAERGHKYDARSVDILFFIATDRNDLAAAARWKEQFVLGPDRGRRQTPRELWYIRGLFELNSGQADEALNDFRNTLTHRPATWNVDTFEDCLANAYLKLGRADEAIAEYERVLKLNPNYPLVHYHVAQAYQLKGQLDQTRAEYQRFLEAWKDADNNIPEVVAARTRQKELN